MDGAIYMLYTLTLILFANSEGGGGGSTRWESLRNRNQATLGLAV